MQTFLPYADFERSARTLDLKRLGKQRVECIQVVRGLAGAGVTAVRSQEELEAAGRLPPWLGDEEFHRSHRSSLLRKPVAPR